MYSGDYRVTMDDRGRIRIPTKLKDMLGDNIVMSGGTDGCAFMMSEADLDAFLKPIVESVKLSDHDKTNMLRKLYSTVYHLSADNQGRYILPMKHRKKIGADKNIVLLGAGTRIEVWAEETYDKLFGDTMDDMDEVFDFLGI